MLIDAETAAQLGYARVDPWDFAFAAGRVAAQQNEAARAHYARVKVRVWTRWQGVPVNVPYHVHRRTVQCGTCRGWGHTRLTCIADPDDARRARRAERRRKRRLRLRRPCRWCGSWSTDGSKPGPKVGVLRGQRCGRCGRCA